MWMLTVEEPDADLQHAKPGNHPTKMLYSPRQDSPSSSICVPFGAGPSGCFVWVRFAVEGSTTGSNLARLIGKRFVHYEARGDGFHHLYIVQNHTGRHAGEADAHM